MRPERSLGSQLSKEDRVVCTQACKSRNDVRRLQRIPCDKEGGGWSYTAPKRRVLGNMLEKSRKEASLCVSQGTRPSLHPCFGLLVFRSATQDISDSLNCPQYDSLLRYLQKMDILCKLNCYNIDTFDLRSLKSIKKIEFFIRKSTLKS